MSLRVNRNLGPFSSGAQTIFALLQWLTSTHGGTKFWSVVASGDGLAAYSGIGNVLSHSGSGANGLDNSNAWFVLADPDASRWLLFIRSGASYQWSWWYKRDAAFDLTGCGPSTPPSIGNNPTMKSWMAARSAGPFNAFPTGGSWYTHICCEGDTPDGDVYPFWCVSRTTGTGVAAGAIWMDCVVDSLSPAGDGDKATLLGANGGTGGSLSYNTGSYLSYSGPSYCCVSGFMDFGGGSEEWNALQHPYYSDGPMVLPGGVGTNPIDGKYPIFPSFIWRGSCTTNGPKGQSNLVRYAPSSSLGFGDVVYDGTDYFLVADHVMLRGWPDSTGPVV